VRLLLPIVAVGWAILCAEHGWGLSNLRALPVWLTVVLSMVEQNLVLPNARYALTCPLEAHNPHGSL
jgi:hypothetical protein